MKGGKPMRRVLLVVMILAVIVGAIAAYPMIRRWINGRDAVWIQYDFDWTQVGELRGGAKDVTVRFQFSGGPSLLEIRPEHLIDGEWTQGEEFTLRIAEEKLCSLPEAQRHRFMARVILIDDGKEQPYRQNGYVRILLTPVE